MLKHDMTAPKMTRVAVRVPHTTLDQINDWVDALGVRRSHFLGIALVAGVRSLIRASALDLSWPTAAIEPSEEPDGETAVGEEDEALGPDWAALQAHVVELEAEVARLRAQAASWQAVAEAPDGAESQER